MTVGTYCAKYVGTIPTVIDKTARIRVALTVEQFWHRIPGGTAVAAAGMIGGLKTLPDLSLIGVAARHPAPPSDPEGLSGIEVMQLSLPRLALYESWHRLRLPSVQSATGDIDVIHATTIAIPPHTAPLAVTIHDLAFIDTPSNFTRRGVRFFERGLALALKDADLIHCPSEATARDCIAAGFDEARIRVVPLGLTPARVTADDVASVRSDYELQRPYVLWTGTIEPRKNLRGVVLGFQHSGFDGDLVLAGPVGWNEDVDRVIDPVRDRVKVLGFVPRQHLDALYAGAAMVCWPSFKEGFGFPVLEAMAQGTPVITSRGTSTEELAGDAALLVDPRSPEEIGDAIASIVQDAALTRKLSEAGRRRVEAFTWAKTAEGIARMYEELA